MRELPKSGGWILAHICGYIISYVIYYVIFKIIFELFTLQRVMLWWISSGHWSCWRSVSDLGFCGSVWSHWCRVRNLGICSFVDAPVVRAGTIASCVRLCVVKLLLFALLPRNGIVGDASRRACDIRSG
mmetsp:Transcript_91461/g.259011  ORF Transcript_91461/g.259011 Transcript_91461/m.259011 type:complete len:129 (-) Transcript_91461:540-926(-)